MSNPQTVVGILTGNGAAQNVVIGFNPDYVEVVNLTDGDQVNKYYRGGSAEGTSVKMTAGAIATTANGITAYNGPTGSGFTIGTDISENGDTLGYLAIRSGPGAV